MIKITDIRELHYRSQIKSEVANQIFDHFNELCGRIEEDDGAEESLKPFVELFGGDLFIVENDEDLKQISTSIPDENDVTRYYDITEIACGFDIMDNHSVKDYLIIVMIWTDTGGPTFMVPNDIANKYKTIKESYRLTND